MNLHHKLVSLYNRMLENPKDKEVRQKYKQVLMEWSKEMQKQPLPF